MGLVSTAAGEITAAAGAPPAPNIQPSSGSVWDSTAITEWTQDSLQFVAPTADRPAYVVTHSGGQHDFGQVPAGDQPPAAGILDQQDRFRIKTESFECARPKIFNQNIGGAHEAKQNFPALVVL